MKTLTLKAADGHEMSLRHYDNGHRSVVVIVHGFYINKDVLLIRQFAEEISCVYDVIVFDLRGHGQSSGWFTWTREEPQDLVQVLDYARGCGYRRTGLIGFSLGAAIALITAARKIELHSLIAVSAPMDFWQINFHFWEPDMVEDLRMNLSEKGKGKGVRPGIPLGPMVRPLDIVGAISPVPVLFIHGSEDWLIKPYHSEKLYAAAGEPKLLRIIPGGGHAERMYDTHQEMFTGLCCEWLEKSLGDYPKGA